MKTLATTNVASPPINIPILNINSYKSASQATINQKQNKKHHHSPAKLFEEIFKEIGYFSYDIFLLTTESFEKLAKIAKTNHFIEPFFMGIEGLCLIVNIKDKLQHAQKEKHSKLRTILEIIGEALSGITWGLLCPKIIIQAVQNAFKAKKPMAKTLTGALGLVILEILMVASGKITDLMAKWIDKTFNKPNISLEKTEY